MNIDKAMRKQKKHCNIFLLSMCFIFFILPAVFVISQKFYLFYIIYLLIIEMLILIAMIIRINNESLKFSYDRYRVMINLGISGAKLDIICDNIVLVHVENYISKNNNIKDFKIIFLSNSKFRSKRMIPIKVEFLRRHPYVAYQYNKMKIMHPDWNVYYTIIKRGGLKKYPLLDAIYKSCVHAHFTEASIDKIKYYRENSENYNKAHKNK